jgi:hypothetical protein
MTRSRLTAFTFTFVALASVVSSGCATHDARPDGAVDDAATVVDVNADIVVAPTPTTLWRQDSQTIDMSCFAFFQGSMRFRANRNQLTADQLALLSNLRAVDAKDECLEDGMECAITIVQADGQATKMDALAGDFNCGQPRQVIAYDTFLPFLHTVDCQHAKDLTFATLDRAKPISPDPRCYNGLFVGGGGGAISVALDVPDATSPRHIELDWCDQPGRIDKLHFSVFESDGTTLLGSSVAPACPGVDGTCATLDLTFPHAGSFELGVAVDPGLTLAGDFFLRFY